MCPSANQTSAPRGSPVEELEATGKRLFDFADTLGLPFEFCTVAEKAGDVDPEKLGVTRHEAVAVHWLHHSLYDVTGSDSNTLWLIQSDADRRGGGKSGVVSKSFERRGS
ncbi:hypothetical protein EJB05_05322, partial [Eragrostis curvula]